MKRSLLCRLAAAALCVTSAVCVTGDAAALEKGVGAAPVTLVCEAPGMLAAKARNAVIDYSNTRDGYVTVLYTGDAGRSVKAQVRGPSLTYTYDIVPGVRTVLPLSEGNGDYTAAVYENVSGCRYANVVSVAMHVELSDEFAPFLRPNCYVDYSCAPETVKKAEELCCGCADELETVDAVYGFVVENFSYDKELAATVKSGYLPELDKVLEKRKGICFDYAAVMTGMLRSRGVPCKLVIGYAGKAYHAWISVYSAAEGWIDGVIYFDGNSWQRMDPTFASSAGGSKEMLEYIGDGSNYTAMYFY